jgi:glycosyltransferase involved in cell wall biosynthesis
MNSQLSVSVVIITLNAASTIHLCINAALKITDDIIVVDSGSTDNTQQIATQLGAKLIQEKWYGYGKNKTIGNNAAKYDWILSLDADEVLSDNLIQSIKNIHFITIAAYTFKRLNFIGNKPIRFGAFKNDFVVRLFNKNYSTWNNAEVHEKVEHNITLPTIKFKGYLNHFTCNSFENFEKKNEQYAQLMADKYFAKGKKANFIKLYLSPIFNFMKNYFFQLGFLDGQAGFRLAIIYAKYTFNKYRLLKIKWQQKRS